MVKLRGRLVVPGAPARAAVEADGRPLIAAERDDARIGGVDPDALVIISARRSFDCGERAPAVERSISGRIRHVDDVGIVRRHRYPHCSGTGAGHPALVVYALPVLPAV